MENYLTGCPQRTLFNGSWKNIPAVVTQGSALEALLLLIYTNYLRPGKE